jgi:MoaA/NifB/PqqE/SkfB family radical SAM enzyme
MISTNDILSAPCEVAIEITGRCNLECKYCFSDGSGVDIPLDKLKKILNQADEMNVFEVCFSGGEPFFRSDIFDILNYAAKKDFDLSIVTNGTLLDSKKIECINDLGLMGSVQISVDSSNEHIHNSVRGSFSKTMSSLKDIKRICDDLPTIGIVLHKQNYRGICNSLSALSEYCSGFHLMNVMCTKKALENRDFLFLDYSTMTDTWNEIDRFCKKNSINIDIYDYDLKKKETARFTGCTAGKTKVAITSELNVIPCDMTRSLIIGNLNNDTLHNIWNSTKAEEIRNLDIEPCYQLNKQLEELELKEAKEK